MRYEDKQLYMISIGYLFSLVQLSCTVVSNSLRPHGLQHTSLSITSSQSLLKLMSIASVMPSSHLILCRPLLLLLQSFPASGSFPMSQFFATTSYILGPVWGRRLQGTPMTQVVQPTHPRDALLEISPVHVTLGQTTLAFPSEYHRPCFLGPTRQEPIS